jgi:xylan 1,4-beta-xylosidase
MVDSSVRRNYNDVGGLGAKDKKSATVMIWNYHDDDVIKPALPVAVNINGLPATSVTITEYRIDNENSNSYTLWKRMGSPQNPTTEEIALMEKAGQLQIRDKQKKVKVKNGQLVLNTKLPQQAVTLFKINW